MDTRLMNKPASRLASILAILMLCLHHPQSVSAHKTRPGQETDSKKVSREYLEEKYMSIPLLFMTDRELNDDQKSFANRRHTETRSIYDVYCGTVPVPVLNVQNKDMNEKRKALGWQAEDKASKKLDCRLLNGKAEPSSSLGQFGDLIISKAREAGSDEICLFVHGFKNSFESGARKAANLAYNMECPVIYYSWPSAAKVFQYFVDSGSNEWSQEHFNRLLEELMAVKEKSGLKVHAVAHSMGNRLAVRSVGIMQDNKHLFDKIFLVDPDFDSQTFMHYVARYAHKRRAHSPDKICILFSHKDRALPVAQRLFGGYTRLGQGADTILESLLKPQEMIQGLLDGGKSAFGLKDLFFEDEDDSTAHNLFTDEFEWIDFTVLDHGFMGHTVPYKLITSLVRTGKPGPGLAFKPVKIELADFKSKTLECFFGNNTPDGIGKCKRVVFVDQANRNDSGSDSKDSGRSIADKELNESKSD